MKKELIDLDQAVINALNLFIKEGIPKLETINYKRPLILGSENAAITGKIIFEDKDAVFSDVSNYKKDLKTKNIDGAVLISASGEKSAPGIAKFLKKKKIKLVLFTNNPKSEASEYADKVLVFPKNPEPYTYNTSTYMGMILAKTKENPKKIMQFINNKIKAPDLTPYDSYYFIIPDKLDNIKDMLLTKFDELFGSKISARAFTLEKTKHAKTVIPSEKELFVSLGTKNNTFGKNRLELPLPKNANYGAIMAIGYYFIGQIQKQNPPWFKQNIEKYVKKTSKIFNDNLKLIG